MTERGARSVSRDASTLQVGRSAMSWRNGELIVDIDEISTPIPGRIRGRVTLTPRVIQHETFTLDARGGHVWRPIAPVADVRVELDSPRLTWSGHGYFDTNAGAEALEDGFRTWHWSRGQVGDEALILYDAERRDGASVNLALRIGADGRATPIEAPPVRDLQPCGWGIARATRSADAARLLATFEDTPFYARSKIETSLAGQRLEMMHESLDLDRFATAWVKLLLPFRMPRIV